MNSKLDGSYHWFSAGSFALTLGMLCAGQTALEPALQGGSSLVSLGYWSVCFALTLATVGFSFVALLQAQEHIKGLEGKLQVKRIPVSGARFSPIKSQKIDA